MSAYNLYLTSTYSMSHAEGLSPQRKLAYSEAEPFVVCNSCLLEAATPVNRGHIRVCMHRFANVFYAYIEWKARIR